MGNYSKEQIEFAYEKIKQLLSIVGELEENFEGRHFTLDGHLLGSIGEVMSGYYYGIELYDASAPIHDGKTQDGREVQVKITQQSTIVMSEEPDYLICLFLNRQTGEVLEIYNGLGKEPWEKANVYAKRGIKMISISKLATMDLWVEESERISAVNYIGKYQAALQNCNGYKKTKATGKTLVQGYVNRNNQKNCGCTGEEGSHAGQLFYLMKCLRCGFEYKSNGCDVWLRKCPKCM